MKNLKPGKIFIHFLIILVMTFHLVTYTFCNVTEALPVFPGAEGFGVNTPAGRGGTVYKVTNLNASGPGSLKNAIEATGPRVVVFEVSGTIQQDGLLNIVNPYITIAGQTAPSPGITLRGATVEISTHDILIQHIRIRVGDQGGYTIAVRDGISINSGGGKSVYNVVIDHCSVSWSLDGIMDFYVGDGTMNDITVRNCILSEAIELPFSSKAMNFMPSVKDVSLIGNLYAHNGSRNPRIVDDTDTLVINNVVYNSQVYGIAYSNNDSVGPLNSSAIGNVAIPGPDTLYGTLEYNMAILSKVINGSQIYVDDNVCNDRVEGDPWSSVKNYKDDSVKATTPPVWVSPLTVKAGIETLDWVLANAGARPADRDSVDTRLVNDVINKTGQIINSQNDVGGWPVLAQNTRPLTIPNNPNGDDDGDGYTSLEEWLHSYAANVEGGTTSPDNDKPTMPSNLQTTSVSSSQINLSWSTSTDPVVTGQATSGVSGYRIYRDGTQIASTANTTYQDTGLSPSTTYSYAVSAYDAAGNESLQSDPASATTNNLTLFSTLFEAEDMNLISPMTTESDTNASRGQYISPTTGTNSTSPQQEASFSITLPETGTYYLWIRMMGPDSQNDALYVGIDTTWDRVYPSTTNVYEWIKVATSNNSGNYGFNLTQGSHVFQIGHGEINAQADALFLTNDPNGIPSSPTPDTNPPSPPFGLSIQ